MSTAQPIQAFPTAALPTTAPRRFGRLAVALIGLNVAGLLLASTWLRVWQLDHLPGINGDEAWYGIQAMRLLAGDAVAWRTPTNNVLNPFYFVPLLALHTLGAPSAAMLRWPAVASGLLALVVNYWLCRRTFDRPTAMITTAMLAVLPINIAYSRFGWDTSQTLLFTLPAVYLPLLAAQEAKLRQRWIVAAGLALAASLIVHPTNIFTMPLLVIPLAWACRGELLDAMHQPRPIWQWIAAGTIAVFGFVIVLGMARHWLATIASRLAAPLQLWEFFWHYQRLFSGLTVYRFIVGSTLTAENAADWLWLDAAAWLFAAVIALGLWNRYCNSCHERRWQDVCLLCGWAAMLLGFYLVAGPRAIAPHYERYALCLIAPAIVLAGRGLGWWIVPSSNTSPRRNAWLPMSIVLALGWLALLDFDRHYLRFIHETGGGSHATFRTAHVEPKQAALAEVLRQRNVDQMSWIVTAEYWNEKPLTYLAAGQEQLRVEKWSAVRDAPALLAAAQQHRVWFVEFADSEACRQVQDWFREHQLPHRELAILDYAGRPVLLLLAPAP